uniref:Uncharacterized protein n=1 Tax=Tanacetum cinerariifolium TaxID=118510 RepID=A0A6L2NER5_TANCI|nr:hypothetical protein [Tanacetum cinerariifolium]
MKIQDQALKTPSEYLRPRLDSSGTPSESWRQRLDQPSSLKAQRNPSLTTASGKGRRRVSFRLGGKTRTMSLLEFRWRVSLYDEEVASHEDTVRTLRSDVTVRREEDWRPFWPTIGNDRFIVRSTIVSSIRDLGVRSLPKKVSTMNVLCGGMFVTKIARSVGLLGGEMIEALSVEPGSWVFPKKVGDNSDDEEDGEVGDHEGAYRDMRRGAWQERQRHWMEQQDERWEHIENWMTRQDQQANWIIWKTFGGNTRNLGSIWEENGQVAIMERIKIDEYVREKKEKQEKQESSEDAWKNYIPNDEGINGDSNATQANQERFKPMDVNNDFGNLDDYLIPYDDPYYVDEQERRFKECVAIEEYEQDICLQTKESISQVYKNIFRKKEEVVGHPSIHEME